MIPIAAPAYRVRRVLAHPRALLRSEPDVPPPAPLPGHSNLPIGSRLPAVLQFFCAAAPGRGRPLSGLHGSPALPGSDLAAHSGPASTLFRSGAPPLRDPEGEHGAESNRGG